MPEEQNDSRKDDRPYSTNLLTLSEKTQEDIRKAKEAVDANEK